jgi:predicted ATPase
MWVEELSLENIKCFESTKIRFGTSKEKYKWVTLLGENGGGKSTILQALGLLLAGPEGALNLGGGRRLFGWLQDEAKAGKLSIRLHKDKGDPGNTEDKVFEYAFFVTGSRALTIERKTYSEPTIVEKTSEQLTWLRNHAMTATSKGWFGAGYGPFRRLTTRFGNQKIVPAEINYHKFSNFITQFDQDSSYSLFEQWMIWLDYQIAKNGSTGSIAKKQRDTGINAINQILANNAVFDQVDGQGNILFNDGSNIVPVEQLSDGFRSVLALVGDLLCRVQQAFPESNAPLEEPGVVLIDELDIHLHPEWQRKIPGLLQDVFPNIQFIVATHSPLIAAGAGAGAVTYRIHKTQGDIAIEKVDNIAFKSVDNILQSEAFSLASTYSPDAEETLQNYLALKSKKELSEAEAQSLGAMMPQVRAMMGRPVEVVDEEEEALRKEMIEHLKKTLPK